MRSRSLANLEEDVRIAADIQYATGRHPQSEVWEDINQSIARLYVLLDRLDNQYYCAEYTWDTSTGTAAYDLPADFWVLKACKTQLSTGQSYRVTPFMANEQVWLDNTTYWPNAGWPLQYRLKGESIELSPVPKGTYTMRIRYTPQPPRLTEGADCFDGVAGFERWVILDAAIKRKQKDSLDAGMLMQEKAELEQWIVSLGNSRDSGEPQRVSDTQSQDRLQDVLIPFWQV